MKILTLSRYEAIKVDKAKTHSMFMVVDFAKLHETLQLVNESI